MMRLRLAMMMVVVSVGALVLLGVAACSGEYATEAPRAPGEVPTTKGTRLHVTVDDGTNLDCVLINAYSAVWCYAGSAGGRP